MVKTELTLVGLASGTLDSLTLNGLSAIKDAEVIIFEVGLNHEIRSLWSPNARTIMLHYNTGADSRYIESIARLIADTVRSGLKVVRLSLDQPSLNKCLDAELKILRKLGIGLKIVPSLLALKREAWELRLPWLSEAVPPAFRIIQSQTVQNDKVFWRQLAQGHETLILDLGYNRLVHFMDRLLLAGADPERPLALVAHHPTQSPLCWLTTLEEVDELWPQWRPNAATIVYIGNWPHTVRESDHEPSFWGAMEAAAANWLRAQRA